MATTTEPISTLHNLLDYDARQFISAEIQLKNSLEKWIIKASALPLKTALQGYKKFIEEHIQKIETFFQEEKITMHQLTNKTMQALTEDLDEKLSLCTDAEVSDASLLAGLQVINHYKISLYGTAETFANTLGMQAQAAVFYDAEINEKEMDKQLSRLAEDEINLRARAPIVIASNKN